MNTKFYEQLSSDLATLFENETEYNVVIEVGEAPNNHSFKAHSIILNSRCSYFQNKLSTVDYNNNFKKIELPDVSTDIFSIILNGTVSLESNPSTIFDTLITFDDFGFKEFVIPSNTRLPPRNKPPSLSISSLTFDEEINIKDLDQNHATLLSRYEESLVDFNKTLEIDQNNAKALSHRGMTLLVMGRREESLADLNKSLEINPYCEAGLMARILTYQSMGKYVDELLKLSIVGLEIDFFATRRKGNIYNELGQYEESITCLNKTLAIRSNDMGKYNESIADFNKSLEISPNNVMTLNAPYQNIGKHNESLADLNKSLEISPDCPDHKSILMQRGIAYYNLDMFKESFDDLNKFLESDPKNETALKYRKEIYRKTTSFKFFNW
ncbi:3772_t:CDS:2 [Cetraspora pellucida]|uniref:3772_t:CDS:1 n=1 Tax=Cetraspora pellucida TaxID=1433469 RepID=A0A9N8WBR1_9GLOM|nr:3772_t:CDS:2 [Cetraspora pellucida]